MNEITIKIEAMDPEELAEGDLHGVSVHLTGERAGMGEYVELTGSRAQLVALVTDGWGEDELAMHPELATPDVPTVPVLVPYESDVQYEVWGETRKLTLIFQGGPTDYYWNASAARDFYAKRIEEEGGKITAYGTRGASGPALAALPVKREPMRQYGPATIEPGESYDEAAARERAGR